MRYIAPPPESLQALKRELGKTGNEMADLFGVAGGPQWRKYTGGNQPRDISPQILFFGVARLVLSPEELNKVLNRMRELGAEIDLDAPDDRERDAA
ncbi:XRE family transcriptional regulator [Cupriavidus gilardii]|nr:XRE family transcriptional regulator [Cupriavidus gilardii]